VQRLLRHKSPNPVPSPAVSSTTTVDGASPSHVLIADNNARTLAARAAQLAAAGLRVSLAHTAFEAIVKASCYVPDFILLDASLGDMNATETGQLLTTCPVTAHIPIFRLTPGRRVPRRVLAATLRLAD
jgi:response regulator RpfG family c-di-GMP phosphodiesterase